MIDSNSSEDLVKVKEEMEQLAYVNPLHIRSSKNMFYEMTLPEIIPADSLSDSLKSVNSS